MKLFRLKMLSCPTRYKKKDNRTGYPFFYFLKQEVVMTKDSDSFFYYCL